VVLPKEFECRPTAAINGILSHLLARCSILGVEDQLVSVPITASYIQASSRKGHYYLLALLVCRQLTGCFELDLLKECPKPLQINLSSSIFHSFRIRTVLDRHCWWTSLLCWRQPLRATAVEKVWHLRAKVTNQIGIWSRRENMRPKS
jgi:hypothetical protein